MEVRKASTDEMLQQEIVCAQGYKQTEAGVIPDEWSSIPIGNLLTFKNGLNKAKQFFGKGTPIVNYMDVYQNPGLTSEKIAGKVTVTKDERNNYSATVGDVFFTRTSETVDEIGLSSVLLEEVDGAVFSGFVLRGRPLSNELQLEFKKYCFRHNNVRRQIISTSSYTTRALTNGRLLSQVYLPVPPTQAEQEAIAKALSDTDALIESLEQLIAKKRDIKQGTMQELLTGKRRLPGFSGEWKVKRLGDVAHIKTGSRNNQEKTEEGEYPFYVRSAKVERINSYSYDCEAILVPGEGGIGSIYHYINGRFDVHQRVYAITKFSEDISGKYVYLYMKENFGAHALQNTVKATVDSLRLPTFQDFEIRLPPTEDEQNAIAAALFDMDAELTTIETQLVKTRQLKQGMMHKLLTGRIRLVTPNRKE